MSLQKAAEFTAAAAKDKALSAQVVAALKGKSPDACAAAFADLGRSKGYDFTAAEAAQARTHILGAAALSDDDLEKVAAGAGAGNQYAWVIYGMGQAFGAMIPGGGPVGEGIGNGLATAISGGNSSDIATSIMSGMSDALDKTRSAVQSIFSGW